MPMLIPMLPASAVVHNDVLPFYQAKELQLDAILTDNGREFCGEDAHPYELYLELNDIEHRKTHVRRLQTNELLLSQGVRNES